MAIEIIVRGKLPAEIKYRLTCSTCKTQFRCLQSDCDKGGRYNEVDYSIKCPVCSTSLVVDERDEEKEEVQA
jgi:DNA-directed RNA polymerase subunit RPC12/RpoP